MQDQSNEQKIDIPELKLPTTQKQVSSTQGKSSKRFHSPRYISRKAQNQRKFFKSPNQQKNKPEQRHQIFRYLSPKKINKNNGNLQISQIQKSLYVNSQDIWFQSSISQIGQSFLTQKLSQNEISQFQSLSQNLLVSQFDKNKQKNSEKEVQITTLPNTTQNQINKFCQIGHQALQKTIKRLEKQNQYLKQQLNQKNISQNELKQFLQKLQQQKIKIQQKNKSLQNQVKLLQTNKIQNQVEIQQSKEINNCLQDIIMQLNQRLQAQNIQKNNIQIVLQEISLERNSYKDQLKQYAQTIRSYEKEAEKNQMKFIDYKNAKLKLESLQTENEKNNEKYLFKFQKQLSYLLQLIKEERQINQNLVQQLKYRDISLTILKKKQLQIQCKEKQLKKLKTKNRKLMDRVQILLQEKQKWTQKRSVGRSSSCNKSQPKNINITHKTEKSSHKQKQRLNRIEKNFSSLKNQSQEEQISLQLSPVKQ